MISELSTLLKKRFGSRPYWRTIERSLRHHSPSFHHPVYLVGDDELSPSSMLKHVDYSLWPFLTAYQEVIELRQHVLQVCPDAASLSTEDLAQSLEEHILRRCDGLSSVNAKSLQKLLESSSSLRDVAEFMQEFVQCSSPAQIVEDAQWIWDQQRHSYTLMIGAELFWLMTISRCLGLILLSSLQRLRTANIAVIGASAAAMTVDTLVSLGCSTLKCIDPGFIDPSNSPRLPMGEFADWGKSKVQVLAAQLSRRNPYANVNVYQARIGKEVRLSSFLGEADIILEVVDDVKMKAWLHQEIFLVRPNAKLLFIADVGNKPIVKVVTANDDGSVERPFGREWSKEERQTLGKVARAQTSSEEIDVRTLQQLAYLGVADELPTEQAFQFLLASCGILPFWAQTPIASRMSAALAVTAVLQILEGKTANTQWFGQSLADPNIAAASSEMHSILRDFLGLTPTK